MRVQEVHQCGSEQRGEWIFFHCPICDYLRRMDPATGETDVITEGDTDAQHCGLHWPSSRSFTEAGAVGPVFSFEITKK